MLNKHAHRTQVHCNCAKCWEEAAWAVVSGCSKDGLSWECSLGLRELVGRKPAELAPWAWPLGE